MSTRERKSERKMGGLPLPEVVKQLLQDVDILRWDPVESVYLVLHGEKFESRFNELRRVRIKNKASGIERPFSRMHNFFALESGEKWARTGTKFKPINDKGVPTVEILDKVAKIEQAQKDKLAKAAAKAIANQERGITAFGGAVKGNRAAKCAAPTIYNAPAVYEAQVGTELPDAILGKRRINYIEKIAESSIPHLIDAVADRLVNKRPHYEIPARDAYQVNNSMIPEHLMQDVYGCGPKYSPWGFQPAQYTRRPNQWVETSPTPESFYEACAERFVSLDADVRRPVPSYDCVDADPRSFSKAMLSPKMRHAIPPRRRSRVDEEDEVCEVYEISSEGGSCQPSPEVALSLCGDLDLLPLDLGESALGAAVAHSSHSLVGAPIVSGSSLAAAVDAALVPAAEDPLMLDLLSSPPASPRHCSSYACAGEAAAPPSDALCCNVASGWSAISRSASPSSECRDPLELGFLDCHGAADGWHTPPPLPVDDWWSP